MYNCQALVQFVGVYGSEMRFFKNFKAQDKAQALGYMLVLEIF